MSESSNAAKSSDTPETDTYYSELRRWLQYCKRYPNMSLEQAEQCPPDCNEEKFAKRLERRLHAYESAESVAGEMLTDEQIDELLVQYDCNELGRRCLERVCAQAKLATRADR